MPFAKYGIASPAEVELLRMVLTEYCELNPAADRDDVAFRVWTTFQTGATDAEMFRKALQSQPSEPANGFSALREAMRGFRAVADGHIDEQTGRVRDGTSPLVVAQIEEARAKVRRLLSADTLDPYS